MKKILWSFTVPSLLLLAVIYWQYLNCSIEILPRYGSILIIFGIFIDGQLLIRGKNNELTLNSSVLTIPNDSDVKRYRSLKYKFSLLKPGRGLLLIIIGTFFWGFGDLTFKC